MMHISKMHASLMLMHVSMMYISMMDVSTLHVFMMWSLLVTDKRTHRLTYSRIRKNARWKQCCAIRDSAWWRLGEEAMAPAGVIYDLGKETQSIPG